MKILLRRTSHATGLSHLELFQWDKRNVSEIPAQDLKIFESQLCELFDELRRTRGMCMWYRDSSFPRVELNALISITNLIKKLWLEIVGRFFIRFWDAVKDDWADIFKCVATNWQFVYFTRVKRWKKIVTLFTSLILFIYT